MMGSCLTNGGQPSWHASFASLVGLSSTGSVKGWSGHASSTNPCTAGWCGPTKRNKNDFNSIISAQLETNSAIDGPMRHLPNNPDEDIIPTNHERRAQWHTLRNKKQYLGVVWLGH